MTAGSEIQSEAPFCSVIDSFDHCYILLYLSILGMLNSLFYTAQITYFVFYILFSSYHA